MTLMIQVVRTIWTKKSRGGQGAAKRNSVPEVVPFAGDLSAPDGSHAFHLIDFDEREDFSPRETFSIKASAAVTGLGCVSLREKGEELEVTYGHRPEVAGAPARARRFHAATVMTLPKGAWGRVAYNGRFADADTGTWWYEKRVFNIQNHSTGRPIFSGTPHAEHRDMAGLW